jgi:hypothetical protein
MSQLMHTQAMTRTRTHTHTHAHAHAHSQPVEPLCLKNRSSQGLPPDNRQHSQETEIHVTGGIRTRNPRNPSAVEPRLTPRSHQHWIIVLNQNCKKKKIIPHRAKYPPVHRHSLHTTCYWLITNIRWPSCSSASHNISLSRLVICN